MKKTGIVLLIIGLIITGFSGFSFITREKVIDIGSVEVTANKKNRIEWPPILGLIIMAVGGGVFIAGTRQK
jgi:hypothetical protein